MPEDAEAAALFSPERTEELVRELRAGRRERFDALHARLAPALDAWAALRVPAALRARLDADDLAQEVWARACERLATYDSSSGPLRPWLFGIARHVLLHALRALRTARLEQPTRAERALEEEAGAETSLRHRLMRDEALARCVALVEALPAEERELCLLHGLEGRSLVELAPYFNASVEALKKRWQRLRARVQAEAERANVSFEPSHAGGERP